MKEIIQLEKKIRGKIHAIKNGIISPKESKIGLLFNRLKDLDEASYEELISYYKTVMDERSENP